MEILVTAHGGAHKTFRNSKRFFAHIADWNVDVIEVDIWKCGKRLYLSHLPGPPFLRLPLRYAFRFIKEHDFKINCDVKQKGLVKHVLDLAKAEGVVDRIIFTGSVSEKDIPRLTEGEVYLNKSFFGINAPKVSDVKTMAEKIMKFGCPQIKGINLKYTFLTEEFLDECEKYGLVVSAFVVDEDAEVERLLQRRIIVNITSNYPELILERLERNTKK
ncbi:MAG TPA: hypothetical protein PKY53_02350 [Clostridia bacterium]|nr:hypothetical protein [Clostridia bacterium]